MSFDRAAGPVDVNASLGSRPRRGARAARLPAAADAREAVRAVDGLVAARLEGDLGLLAAARAGGREHLPARAVVAAAVAARAAVVAATATATATEAVAARRVAEAAAAAAALLLARAPALRAASGLVGQAAALVELLLAGRERELLAAVAAGQGPVLKHRARLLQVRSSTAVSVGFETRGSATLRCR